MIVTPPPECRACPVCGCAFAFCEKGFLGYWCPDCGNNFEVTV